MKVLITRPRAQADDFAEKLRQAGFEPILFPVIEIRPIENNAELESAIRNIQKYAWVVFTSVNAVDVVFQKMQCTAESAENAENKEKISANSVFSVAKIAAVGTKTAEALRQRGIEPDFIPDEFTGVNIMAGLGDVNGKWILLPRAEIASRELPEAIVQAGGIAHEIIVYRTLPAVVDEDGLHALQAGVDYVTFTSPSTVQNFVEVARKNRLDPFHLPNSPTFACIGTVTEKAARKAGFEKIITAKEFTTDGLLRLLVTLTA